MKTAEVYILGKTKEQQILLVTYVLRHIICSGGLFLGNLGNSSGHNEDEIGKTGEHGARGFLEIVHLSCHIGHLANLETKRSKQVRSTETRVWREDTQRLST